MLAHNEPWVCARVSSLQSIPNFLSFSHPLELQRRRNPREAITMTTAVRICTTVISVVREEEGKKKKKEKKGSVRFGLV